MKKIKKIAIASAVLGCSTLFISNSFANDELNTNNETGSTNATTNYVPETTVNNTSSVLNLKGRIDGNYKVILKWNPLSSEIENYILLFSSTNSEPTYPIKDGDKVFTIDSNKTETIDWSSKKGVNYYRLGAIDTNGNVTLSNTIKIMMDGNGKTVYDESMLKDNNNSENKDGMDRKPEVGDNHGMNQRPEMRNDNNQNNYGENNHGMNQKPEMKGNDMQPKPTNGDIPPFNNFFKQDLSIEQLKIANDTMYYFKKSFEEVIKNAQSKDDFNTKVEDLKDKLYTNMSQYVDESKIEDFKKFVDEKTSPKMPQDTKKDLNNGYNQTSSGRYQNSGKMQDIKNNIKPKQGLKDKYVSQLREKYTTLINSIPSEKLSLVLDKINSKIDSITNSDLKQDIKERSLAMLQALAELINERIADTASGISVEDLLK